MKQSTDKTKPILAKRPEELNADNCLLVDDQANANKVANTLQADDIFQTIFKFSRDGIAIAEIETGNIYLANEAMCAMLGYSLDELESLHLSDIHPEKDLSYVFERFELFGREGLALAENIPMKKKDGSVFLAEIMSSPITLNGKRCLKGSFRDITERKLIEDKLKETEGRFLALFQQSLHAVYIHDFEGNFIDANQCALDLFGYSKEELNSINFAILLDESQLPMAMQAIQEIIDTGKQNKILEYKLRRKNGEYLYMETAGSLIFRDGKPVAILGVAKDIMARKQLEMELRKMATHDSLTGLPNRLLLHDRFNIAQANVRRRKKKLATIILDLDKFKIVNDTLGHDNGDKLLVAAANRLKSILRESDTIARIGGDEFILLGEIDEENDAVKLAERILEDFRHPFIIDEHELSVTASIGIALFPDDGTKFEDLVKCSDKSLYIAKESGRNQFAIYFLGL